MNFDNFRIALIHSEIQLTFNLKFSYLELMANFKASHISF